MRDKKDNDRRRFLKAAGGAALALGSVGVLGISGQHHGKPDSNIGRDPLGSATVSFGGWMTDFDPPLDRYLNPLPPPPSNHHVLVPSTATIRAGGYVNFLISGLHVVSIYSPGIEPSDIDAGNTIPMDGPLPPLINDMEGLIYRGANPVISTDPLRIDFDRVEVVHFNDPGLYLVICAVLPHFLEGMYGWVRVLPAGDADQK